MSGPTKAQEGWERPIRLLCGKGAPGFALIAALLLMVITGLAGVVVLQTTSTEVKISGNYKREVQQLYRAEAGIAEARRRLRGVPSPGQPWIGDPVPDFNPQWSAYILASQEWTPAADRTYRSASTNYIPTQHSQTNTRVVANSFQSSLPFWSKIRHKTEFDAEQAGHRVSSPHYHDGDGSLKRHRAHHVGEVVYYGFPTRNARRPIQFTSASVPMGFPVELITASGGQGGAGPVIEVEVVRPPGPKILAALYSKGAVVLSGALTNVSGVDACGSSPAIPPVYTTGPLTIGKMVTLHGVPPAPMQGSLDINLIEGVKALKSGATVLTSAAVNRNFGGPNDYVTIVADAGAGEWIFRGVRGFGILLIEGDGVLESPFEWNGLVISTGRVTLKGSRGGISVNGAIWVNQMEDLAGQLAMRFNSCQIKAALFAKPLQVRWWREVL